MTTIQKVVDTLVPKVIRSIKNSVTRLIHAGAANIMVHATLPFGCQLNYLQKFRSKDPLNNDHSYRSLNSFNVLSDLHNSHLNQALIELRSQHPHIQIRLADCCHGGVTTTAYSNPKKYIHLDENHLTQEANKFMVKGFLTGSFVYPNLNLPDRSV